MSDHYFENKSPLTSPRFTIKFTLAQREFELQASPGVFSKKALDLGTRMLLEALLAEKLQGKFLDLGCGYGPVGCVVASAHPQLDVTLVDINERAVADAKHNAQRLGLSSLHIVASDGFQALTQSFDWIAFNPPIRAGKKVIYQLYEQIKQHLYPHGSCLIVIRKDKGAVSHLTFLETLFSNIVRLRRDQGYHVYKVKS
jgi:16S rRNA (guanine1207-N2)-methyltransferase